MNCLRRCVPYSHNFVNQEIKRSYIGKLNHFVRNIFKSTLTIVSLTINGTIIYDNSKLLIEVSLYSMEIVSSSM